MTIKVGKMTEEGDLCQGKSSKKNKNKKDLIKNEMIGTIRLVGMFGLTGFLCYLGYLFYDKNQIIGWVFILVGLSLSIYIITSEIEFKRTRHDAPWNFEHYQGY